MGLSTTNRDAPSLPLDDEVNETQLGKKTPDFKAATETDSQMPLRP